LLFDDVLVVHFLLNDLLNRDFDQFVYIHRDLQYG
jgi:hypothetical protein